MRWILCLLLVAGYALGADVGDEGNYKGHAIALHNDIKYGPDYEHFDYVNPDAPKGGTLHMSALRSYDSLNPYILKGVAATGLGLIYDSLLVSSADEPFTEYGLLAKEVEVPEDGSWVAFHLRPEAMWHDGVPLTADDIVFSFNTVIEKGHPFYKSYYADVTEVEALDEATVKFTFASGDNKELPLIMGQIPILPKHYWEDKDFSEPTLEPPLGSGPYRIAELDEGRSITYERVEDYWGLDLPINIGTNNFDTIQYDYYQDGSVALEAFKAGEYDVRFENTSSYWATAYDIPAVERGHLITEMIPNQRNQGMQGFLFNTRKEKLSDPEVRAALAYAFDFEWSNKNLFYGQYTRTNSYFSNSELGSSGVPEGEELALLEPFRDSLPEALFTEPYVLPETDGSGNLRQNLRTATALLAEAGWNVVDGVLTNEATKEAMELEILLISPAFERIVAPFAQNLEKLGIKATITLIPDSAQYVNRVQAYDFDIMVYTRRQSDSPGNEQRDYWHSEVADIEGGSNYAGVRDPVVDSLIETIIKAPDRDSLVTATQALDRVLLWGHYVIPQWYIASDRTAYWNKFSRPENTPPSGVSVMRWWYDEDKASTLE